MNGSSVGLDVPLAARRHRAMRVLHRAMLFTAAAGLAAIAPAAHAANCTIATTSVAFGAYDVFAASPNESGTGTVTVDCKGGAGEVTLSTGQSGAYASRWMTSGADALSYNLYTSAARSTIWGDGTGGSSSITSGKNATATLTVYGRIPAGQDAAVGTYTDSVTATVTF